METFYLLTVYTGNELKTFFFYGLEYAQKSMDSWKTSDLEVWAKLTTNWGNLIDEWNSLNTTK